MSRPQAVAAAKEREGKRGRVRARMRSNTSTFKSIDEPNICVLVKQEVEHLLSDI